MTSGRLPMRAGGWVTGLVSAALASVALIPADALTASVPSGFHISVLAHVPGAREMAPCGNFLYVGTAGSRVYSVALNGGRVAAVPGSFAAPNGVACTN